MQPPAGLSLIDGPLVPAIEFLVVVLLLVGVGWRTRRFRTRWLPICVVLGLAGAVGAWLFFRNDGLATDPAPFSLWIWSGLAVLALAVAIVGWSTARWWRRALTTLVVPLCVLALALSINQWVGYFLTVQSAYAQLTASPLPDQVDPVSLPALRGKPRATGAVVPVTIPATASGFAHRTEYVYLPPVWFDGATPPRLPAIMMLGAEFATPSDWARTGRVIPVMDAFARAHEGRAPVLVFADSAGSFNNDTECVDGPRGNAAGHLTKDVQPFVESRFAVSDDARQWAVAGWSSGGTCSLDLVIMHPQLFDTAIDIAGDAGPNDGDKQQTVERLYGGDLGAWSSYDPATVLTRSTRYDDTAVWFDDSSMAQGRSSSTVLSPALVAATPSPPGAPGPANAVPGDLYAPQNGGGLGGRMGGRSQTDQLQSAVSLCLLARQHGIACDVHTQPGPHSWKFAADAFPLSLPWLTDRLFTPGSPPGLPGEQSATPIAGS